MDGDAQELGPGVILGRYELVRRRGSGGMGEVWEAYDCELGRAIAIKLLPPGRLGSPAARARLKREAHAMAQLSHPNVAVVHDVGELGGHVFVAMELMRETLRSHLATSRTWRATLELLLA